MRLEGKVAIVTGSGGGLGRAMATALAGEGAVVIAADVDAPSMKQTVDEIKGIGGKATGVHCDVTRLGDVQAMVATAIGEFGRIDILVNNAGGGRFDGGERFLRGISIGNLDKTISLNLKGTMLCTLAVMPI
jgi:NAD(P)-dependent dehydrogenase (short-subunit alcohol dehydrogenase family)